MAGAGLEPASRGVEPPLLYPTELPGQTLDGGVDAAQECCRRDWVADHEKPEPFATTGGSLAGASGAVKSDLIGGRLAVPHDLNQRVAYWPI